MNKFPVAVCFWALLCCSQQVIATTPHPYHVSLAEVEFNAETLEFEIALRVWPEDLEKALRQNEKRIIKLDEEKNLDAIISRYIEQRFAISPFAQMPLADGNAALKENRKSPQSNFRFVGHEKNVKTAWLYFVIPAEKSATQWTIRNRVFMELNEQQFNQVNFKVGTSVSRLSLTRSNPSHRIRINSQVEK